MEKATSALSEFTQKITEWYNNNHNTSEILHKFHLPFKNQPHVFITAFTAVTACITVCYIVYLIISIIHWIIDRLTERGCGEIDLDDATGSSCTDERVFACGQWAEPECERPAKRRYTEGLRWLRQAEVDHRSAANDLCSDSPAYDWVCFKCQQSAEKGIKATLFLTTEEDSSEFGHSLLESAVMTNDDLIQAFAETLNESCGHITRKNFLHYLPFPKISNDMFSEQDADMAFRTCGELLTYIREQHFDRPA